MSNLRQKEAMVCVRTNCQLIYPGPDKVCPGCGYEGVPYREVEALANSAPLTAQQVEVFVVPARDGLDTIRVYFDDVAPGKGYVTVLVFGCAWTAYFNAMGEDTIRQFVGMADVGYLFGKMGYNPHLKQRKQDEHYLCRIITAIKAQLKQDDLQGAIPPF